MDQSSPRRDKRAVFASAMLAGLALSASSHAASTAATHLDKPHCTEASLAEPLSNISSIIIDAGPSELRILGEPSRSSLAVTASLCDSDAQPSVQVRRENTNVVLSVRRSDAGRRFLVGPSTSMLVDIAVPRFVKIEISELIGPTSIREVGAVTVRSGVGTLAISDIRGDVYSRKRMGATSITRIEGNVHVSDGAGQLLLSKIAGDVKVAEDGAGQIMINSVRGNVLIESDASGEIRIGQVTRDVLIKHDASGDIVAHDISGALTIEDKTSGSIVHSNVRGAVRVPVLKKLGRR